MLLDEYIPRAIEVLRKVQRTQRDAMLLAASDITEAILRGNGIFIFGCSHASILAAEVFYRAGGLALINPIFAHGLTTDVRPITRTTEIERLEGYGTVILDTSPVQPLPTGPFGRSNVSTMGVVGKVPSEPTTIRTVSLACRPRPSSAMRMAL